MTETSKPARRPAAKPKAQAESTGVLTAEIAVAPQRKVEYLFGGTGTVALDTWLIPSSFKGPRSQWRSVRLAIVGYAKVENGTLFSGVLPLVVPDNGEAVYDLDEYAVKLRDAAAAEETTSPDRALLQRIYASDANGSVIPLAGRLEDFDDTEAIAKALAEALPDYDPASGTPFEIQYQLVPARI